MVVEGLDVVDSTAGMVLGRVVVDSFEPLFGPNSRMDAAVIPTAAVTRVGMSQRRRVGFSWLGDRYIVRLGCGSGYGHRFTVTINRRKGLWTVGRMGRDSTTDTDDDVCRLKA